MRVFLSWSGERSRAVAEALHDWLPLVLNVTPWMSGQDIAKGERWADILGRRLEDHDVGIICVTPENTHSPWLLFEAGALSKDVVNGRLFPLLLGMAPSEVKGPLSGFQATVIERDDLLALTLSLGRIAEVETEAIIRDRFGSFWPKLEERVAQAARLSIPGERATIQSVVEAFAKYGFAEPTIGSQVDFGSGFESHTLYSTAVEVAGERLWVFGRKNRKLFDKEHRDFLRSLPRRVDAGFDFRVLFLSSEAPPHVLRAAHLDEDFSQQLAAAQQQAVAALAEAGLDPNLHCRTYSVIRTYSALVVDDAVLHTPVLLNDEGRALRLTKTAFSVVNSTSALGRELVNDYRLHWEAGQALNA